MKSFLSSLADALYIAILSVLYAVVVVAFVIAGSELLGALKT